MRTPIVERARSFEISRRRSSARTAASAGFAGHLAAEGAPRASEALPGQSPAAPTGLDALLELQEVEAADERARRRTAARYASSLLDRLEQLRHDILAGGMPAGDLDDLRAALAEEREALADPDLEAVVRDVELRARIEVAKLTRSLRPDFAGESGTVADQQNFPR